MLHHLTHQKGQHRKSQQYVLERGWRERTLLAVGGDESQEAHEGEQDEGS